MKPIFGFYPLVAVGYILSGSNYPEPFFLSCTIYYFIVFDRSSNFLPKINVTGVI